MPFSSTLLGYCVQAHVPLVYPAWLLRSGSCPSGLSCLATAFRLMALWSILLGSCVQARPFSSIIQFSGCVQARPLPSIVFGSCVQAWHFSSILFDGRVQARPLSSILYGSCVQVCAPLVYSVCWPSSGSCYSRLVCLVAAFRPCVSCLICFVTAFRLVPFSSILLGSCVQARALLYIMFGDCVQARAILVYSVW